MSTGSTLGLIRFGTILKNNGNGTILVGLDSGGLVDTPQNFNVPIPLSWAGTNGEFIGGDPIRGSSVAMCQGQGGSWFIVSYLPSNDVFGDSTGLSASSIQDNLMGILQGGRAVMQVKNGHRLFLDPKSGIQIGNDESFAHLNPTQSIFSHNFETQLIFTETARHIQGIIKRDLVENSNRNILGSTLDSQAYDVSLKAIGMDPTTPITSNTLGAAIRNPALVENRSVIYEFAHSFNFNSDIEEISKFTNPKNPTPTALLPDLNRRESRADVMSLSLEAPNHLIESISGTVVDTFGNILDLNRNIIPLGQTTDLTLFGNPSLADGFTHQRAALRKSIAHHWQLNARKGGLETEPMLPPDVTSIANYGRTESQFSFDIDKEGQFKLNVPASSEIGNIGLLARSTNYSNWYASQNLTTASPNEFIKSSTGQEIFLKSFAAQSVIKLSATDHALDGYASPIDFITDLPMTFGTAYHDITKVGVEYTTKASYFTAGLKLINFDKNNPMNTTFVPLPKMVSDTIIVSGKDANAGGRSGTINLDGMIVVNIGSNTVDRQSMWLDYSGLIVSSIGRDLQNVSWAGNFDGDILWSVGGEGIDAITNPTYDTRFLDPKLGVNNGYRNGVFETRVAINGQQMIFRMGPEGISIISPGTITFSCQQDMVFRSNGSIKIQGEQIVMYPEFGGRMVNVKPTTTI